MSSSWPQRALRAVAASAAAPRYSDLGPARATSASSFVSCARPFSSHSHHHHHPSSPPKLVSGGGRTLDITPGEAPLPAYRRLVQSSALARDPHQEAAMGVLQRLFERLSSAGWGGGGGASPPGGAAAGGAARARAGGGFMSSLFGGGGGASSSASSPRSAGAAGVTGVYLWGGTGSGKTLLMELFHAALPPAARKRRVHFHAFMLDVHARLHRARSSQAGRTDPLAHVASELAAEARVLCLDEFQVTDVGDAMILKRLLEALFDAGVVMVATSNRSPDDLYYRGLQRELFLPCIRLLHARCDVHAIGSPTDYRLLATRVDAGKTWLTPQRGPSRDADFDALWQRHRGGGSETVVTLSAHGRDVVVPRAVALSTARPAARFTFQELCGAPLYAADYASIAGSFACVYVEGIPRLSMNERNELRRLITLVDVLYDHGVKLVATAEDEPAALFTVSPPAPAAAATNGAAAPAPPPPTTSEARLSLGGGAAGAQHDEVFAWDRCVSRLLEMAGEEYLQQPWQGASAHGPGSR
jgi:predicted ATPase